MDFGQFALIALAGCGAGAINTIVGSGSLISYPTMVLLGIPPVAANVANTVGLVPGSIAGAWGYRHIISKYSRTLLPLGIASIAGALIGALLLIVLPATAFKVIVPILILAATLLVAFQKRLQQALHLEGSTRWVPLTASVFFAGIYGGYFSAAQGVILLGVLGLFLQGDVQVHNGLKNLLQALVNIVAALFFVIGGHVRWDAAFPIAVGSICGALIGAWVAKRIPAQPFRIFIVVFGLVMTVIMAIQAF